MTKISFLRHRHNRRIVLTFSHPPYIHSMQVIVCSLRP